MMRYELFESGTLIESRGFCLTVVQGSQTLHRKRCVVVDMDSALTMACPINHMLLFLGKILFLYPMLKNEHGGNYQNNTQ